MEVSLDDMARSWGRTPGTGMTATLSSRAKPILFYHLPSEPEGHQPTALDLTSKPRQHDQFYHHVLGYLP